MRMVFLKRKIFVMMGLFVYQTYVYIKLRIMHLPTLMNAG